MLFDDLFGSRVLAVILEELGPDCPQDTQRLFGTLVDRGREVSSVEEICQSLEMPATTLTTRFYKAELPSPKEILVMLRLVFVARYCQERWTVSRVAAQLHYSSSQALSRHIRNVLDMSPREFRAAWTGDDRLALFVEGYIRSFKRQWLAFAPFHEGGRVR